MLRQIHIAGSVIEPKSAQALAMTQPHQQGQAGEPDGSERGFSRDSFSPAYDTHSYDLATFVLAAYLSPAVQPLLATDLFGAAEGPRALARTEFSDPNGSSVQSTLEDLALLLVATESKVSAQPARIQAPPQVGANVVHGGVPLRSEDEGLEILGPRQEGIY